MSVAGHHLPIWFDEATGPDDGDVSVWNSATGRFESAPVVGGAIPDGTFVDSDGSGELLDSSVPADRISQSKVNGLVPALAAKKDKATYEIDLRDHGWTGAGSAANDKTALDSALAAAHAATGARGVDIKLVPGRFDLTLGGATTPISRTNVWISGAGPEATLVTGGTGTMFPWGDGVATPYGGGIRGMGISYPAAPDSAAKVVNVDKANRLSFLDLTLDNVRCLASLGVDASRGASVAIFERIYGTSDPAAGSVVIDARFGSGLVANDLIVNAKSVGFPTNATDPHPANDTTFLRFGQGSWDTAICHGVITNRYNRGLDINLEDALAVVNLWFTACIFDYGKTSGIRLRTNHAGANLRSVFFNSGWAVATDGHSIEVAGALGVLRNVHFTDVQGRQAGKNNWKFSGTSMDGISLTACNGIGANRLAATNTGSDQDDLVILGSGVSVRGGKYGEDGSSYVGFTNQGRYGVTLGADVSAYLLRDVESSGAFGFSGDFQMPANSSGSRRRLVSGNRNPTGAPSYAVNSTVTAPASNTLQTHFPATIDTLYIYGGTVTSIQYNGTEVGTTGPATLTIHPGDNWLIIYSVAPTIKRTVRA